MNQGIPGSNPGGVGCFFLKETKKILVQIIKVNNLQIIKVWSNGHKQRKKVFFIQVLNKSSQRIGWSNGQVKKMFCWMWIWKSALRKEHRIFFSYSANKAYKNHC